MRARGLALAFVAITGCAERSSIEIVDAGSGYPSPTPYPTSPQPPTSGPTSNGAPLPCSANGAFGPPALVDGLDGMDIAHPSLARVATTGFDETAIYFDALFAGERTIAFATRPSPTAPFEPASYMPSLGVTDAIGPRSTPLGLVFASHDGGSTLGLFVKSATTLARITPAASTFDETEAFYFESGATSELWFSSNRSGDFAIYRLPYATGFAGTPALVTELDAPGVLDGSPVLSSDGLTIFFASAREDPDATRGVDIFTATRGTMSEPFGLATRVVELSSPGTDAPGWVSRDGCRLYYTSDRYGPRQIWVATRTL